MSTITVIIEPSPDGSLHLPLPEELRNGPVRVVATLTSAAATEPESQPVRRKTGSLKCQIWMAPDFDAPLEDFKDYM